MNILVLLLLQAKGAFLGALSASSTTYPISLELRDALDLPSPGAPPSPYDKARSRVFKEYTKGLHAVRVPEQLSIPEAAAVFEIWMKEKALVPGEFSVFSNNECFDLNRVPTDPSDIR